MNYYIYCCKEELLYSSIFYLGYLEMERIVERGILYDFYGPLLTKHQQEIYEATVYENMSLGEIAEEYSISRQGVHDLIKRCDKILEDYEDKLHLIQRFSSNKKVLTDISNKLDCIKGAENKDTVNTIKSDIDKILEDL